MNNNANIKQFQWIKFINENSDDDHVISKISIVLRRDKIEAPYYMITKIRLSTCIDRAENGLIHAMDTLNHQRMYNLTEEKFNEIKSLILDIFDKDELKILNDGDEIKIDLMSKDDDEFKDLYKKYGELFNRIDVLID
ncbi:hypothetical protein [uncultured Methanobrevibacter sp.]|uniref:hypothetical protein n=1 Tax=uncultured Methanobrevibacter sp. TaxID=253161 RepID=UPI00261E8B73